MNEVVVLTPEKILEATEDVLRRFGLAKATVVDVARALDVSHGSVYRHFPSKVSLRKAVAKRWLDRWLRTMFAIKYKKVCDDPEMFATYLALAQEACEVVKAHKERLVDQIATILSDGVKQGVFAVADPKASARAIFDATCRFHHPAHAEEWKDPELPARIDALLALLFKGLEAPRKR